MACGISLKSRTFGSSGYRLRAHRKAMAIIVGDANGLTRPGLGSGLEGGAHVSWALCLILGPFRVGTGILYGSGLYHTRGPTRAFTQGHLT